MKPTAVIAAAAAVFALAGVTSPPARAAEADAVAAERPTPSAEGRESMWRLEIGYRGAFVTDRGYDPFSTNDYFPQVSMSASRTIYARGIFSFAPGLSWDYGNTGATARGDATSLAVHRLLVPLEGRVHVGRFGYAFVRFAPGVAFESAELDDPTSPAPLKKSGWLAAGDVSGGYAYPLWRAAASDAGFAPGFWLQADGGYGWVAGQSLALAPDVSSGDPRLASGVDLGTLSMQGAFFRVAVALSF